MIISKEILNFALFDRVRKMKKIGYCLLMVILFAAAAYAQDKYVRRRPEHNFFIPQGAMGRPEKLPMPHYTKGEDESVKSLKNAEEVPHWTDDEIEEMRQLAKAPAYQKKYDEYIEDIEEIDENGSLPENEELKEDLQQMDSNEKIRLEIQGGESGKPLF